MRVVCHTNLDLDRRDKWPEEMQVVPRIGDYIRSSYAYKEYYVLELEVVGITWVQDKTTSVWVPHIEMHLPKHRFESIRQFYEWYGKITDRGVHAFI